MYSQNQEEKFIVDYFQGKVGTFADLGANDGKTLSNTRRLVELGWKGIFVEPSPKAFEMLKENYKGIDGLYFYPFALGDSNDMVKFHDSGTHLNKGDHGLLSTMTDSDYQKWRGSTQFETIEVECFRWKTFLNRLTIKTFDFISCDVEGQDLTVLKQIDLTGVKMVCVEWNGKQKEEFSEVCRGFRLIHENAENLIFAR